MSRRLTKEDIDFLELTVDLSVLEIKKAVADGDLDLKTANDPLFLKGFIAGIVIAGKRMRENIEKREKESCQ